MNGHMFSHRNWGESSTFKSKRPSMQFSSHNFSLECPYNWYYKLIGRIELTSHIFIYYIFIKQRGWNSKLKLYMHVYV